MRVGPSQPFFSVAWPLFLGKLTVVPRGRSLGVVSTYLNGVSLVFPTVVVVSPRHRCRVHVVVVVGSYPFWATSQGLVDDLGGLDKAIEVSERGSAFSVCSSVCELILR